jgi:hypothetical protein
MILEERPRMSHDLESAVGRKRKRLEQIYCDVFGERDVESHFIIRYFMEDVVVVTRKIDGAKGTILFQRDAGLFYKFEKM